MSLKDKFAFLKDRKDLPNCCRTGSKLSVFDKGNKVYFARCGICGKGHHFMECEPWQLDLTRNDWKLALWPHERGSGGPPPTRKIYIP